VGMKALSLTQPWATLVVTGRKQFETRSWSTGTRERIAIHASKGMPGWAKDAAREFGLDHEALPRGAIIGFVTIVRCSAVESVRDTLSEYELAYGDYSDGRYAWLLDAPEQIQPVPMSGALGLWPVPSLPATDLARITLSDGHAE